MRSQSSLQRSQGTTVPGIHDRNIITALVTLGCDLKETDKEAMESLFKAVVPHHDR
jgi:hypothetical protein